MSRNCYLSKNYRHTDGAGDKAKTDIETVMSRKGFVNLGLKQRRSKSAVTAYFITLASVLKGVISLRRGDVLVVQYPLKKYYDFVVRAARARGAKVITLIHDLGSFRSRRLTVEQEIARLGRSTVVIAHTEAMKRWLVDNGLKVPVVVLGLFDYLSDRRPAAQADDAARPRLVFAGNCARWANGWIYDLARTEPQLDVVAYGGGIEADAAEPNLVKKGYADSDDLIAGADGRYGVVWYGGSLDEGAGELGEYLRYNAPHKTSLYLRAGLPVIIWDKAALADEIRRHDAGLCVPSLRGLGDRLAALTPGDYERMRRNAAAVADRLAGGAFVSDALDAAVDIAVSAPEK